MSRMQRFISFALSGALLLSGFAIGRWTSPTTAIASEKTETASPVTNSLPKALPEAGSETSAFYLSDYKTGYNDGYQASLTGQGAGLANSTRAGYNEGFKEGYANGYQNRLRPEPVQLSAFANGTQSAAPTPVRAMRNSRTVSRTVYSERPRRSKLKTALTIAAPAAVGAGIGALAGGKKGAGVGALLGGGGGALYHLFKNRR
jgi:hypothetical protein